MIVRFATDSDKLRAVRSIQRNQTSYNTTAQMKEDIACGRLLVVEDNEKLLGSCALVEESSYGYTAIKRVMVYSKRSRRKGIATALITYACSLGLGTVGATPWGDNVSARSLFEKMGFEFQYQFGKYCYYKKES